MVEILVPTARYRRGKRRLLVIMFGSPDAGLLCGESVTGGGQVINVPGGAPLHGSAQTVQGLGDGGWFRGRGFQRLRRFFGARPPVRQGALRGLDFVDGGVAKKPVHPLEDQRCFEMKHGRRRAAGNAQKQRRAGVFSAREFDLQRGGKGRKLGADDGGPMGNDFAAGKAAFAQGRFSEALSQDADGHRTASKALAMIRCGDFRLRHENCPVEPCK